MNNILKNTKVFIPFLAIFLVMGCESDDNSSIIEGTNSIVNYLEDNPDYSIFSRAIERAELDGTLDGNSGTYTVLAPDNDAFDEYLQEEGLDSIGEVSKDKLTRLVNYHVLETLTPADNFVTSYSQTLATVPVNDSVDVNLSLYVNTSNGVAFNGDSKITEGDVQVDNGILHQVDHVLSLPTLKSFMNTDDNLKAFYTKLTANDIPTDFETLLADPETETLIFVPSEVAVNDFFSNEGSGLSPAELDNLYRNHLLDSLQVSSNLRTGYINTRATETYSGNDNPINLYIDAQAGLVLNGGKTIVIPDITAVNGSIQVVDSVLTLPTVKTFVEADLRFDTFESSLSRDDQTPQQYLELLDEGPQNGNSPFTVFAPQNDAFDDLLTELYPEQNVGLDAIDTDELTAILNLHIVENLGLRTGGFSNQNLNTLGGTIQLNASDSTLTDPATRKSKILYEDIQAANGLVHPIETVLLPD